MEQESYHNSLKSYRDMNNVIDTARMEGRSEGIAEGERTTKIEIARSLLQEFSTERISQITGLARTEIEQLRRAE